MKKIRYLIEALILKATLFFFLCFSFNRASNMAALIGRTIGPRLKVSNVARANLKRVMPELAQKEIEQIIVQMWDNLLRVAVELPFINRLSKEDLGKHITLSGKEHLENLTNQPAIIFSGHFGNWELGPRILASFAPTALVYRKSNNRIVDGMINRLRAFNNLAMIPKGREGIKQLISAIKQGRTIAMLVDQKMDNGMEIPFFGIPAMTTDAIARFALDYDRPIIPMYARRINGVNFEVKVFPALKIEFTGNKQQDMVAILTTINLQLEQWIRANPEQWFWLHRRFPN